jgi:hypothetical protein
MLGGGHSQQVDINNVNEDDEGEDVPGPHVLACTKLGKHYGK